MIRHARGEPGPLPADDKGRCSGRIRTRSHSLRTRLRRVTAPPVPASSANEVWQSRPSGRSAADDRLQRGARPTLRGRGTRCAVPRRTVAALSGTEGPDGCNRKTGRPEGKFFRVGCCWWDASWWDARFLRFTPSTQVRPALAAAECARESTNHSHDPDCDFAFGNGIRRRPRSCRARAGAARPPHAADRACSSERNATFAPLVHPSGWRLLAMPDFPLI